MSTLEAVAVIAKDQTFDLGNGKVGVHWPPGESTVLSVQPDGSIETRPSVGGPYEQFDLIDGVLYVEPIPPGADAGITYAFKCKP